MGGLRRPQARRSGSTLGSPDTAEKKSVREGTGKAPESGFPTGGHPGREPASAVRCASWISIAKSVAWAVLAAALGGIAVFVTICLVERLPPTYGWYLWPAACLGAAGAAAGALRVAYGREPVADLGRSSFRLQDLLTTSVLVCVILGGWRAALPEESIAGAMPLVCCSAALLVAGFVKVTRLGLRGGARRTVLATGYAARALGALGLGGWMVALVSLQIGGLSDAASAIIHTTLTLQPGHGHVSRWVIALIYASAASLVYGVAAVRLAGPGRRVGVARPGPGRTA